MPAPSVHGSVWVTWSSAHTELLAWLFVLSLASLGLVAVLLPVVVVRLPADYFARERSTPPTRLGIGALLLRLGKNVLGGVFVLAGIAMLFLPGQGLLTMLIGLMLVDFPGKRALERRLIARPAIRGFLERIRRRHGRGPFVLD